MKYKDFEKSTKRVALYLGLGVALAIGFKGLQIPESRIGRVSKIESMVIQNGGKFSFSDGFENFKLSVYRNEFGPNNLCVEVANVDKSQVYAQEFIDHKSDGKIGEEDLSFSSKNIYQRAAFNFVNSLLSKSSKLTSIFPSSVRPALVTSWLNGGVFLTGLINSACEMDQSFKGQSGYDRVREDIEAYNLEGSFSRGIHLWSKGLLMKIGR